MGKGLPLSAQALVSALSGLSLAVRYSQVPLYRHLGALFHHTYHHLKIVHPSKKGATDMTERVDRRFFPLSLVSSGAAILLAAGLLAGLSTPLLADDGLSQIRLA